MPTVFEKDGYRFFFYSNEHLPVHIHVSHGGGEAIFNIENVIELRDSHNFKIQELSKAKKLAIKNKDIIMEKWNEHTNK